MDDASAQLERDVPAGEARVVEAQVCFGAAPDDLRLAGAEGELTPGFVRDRDA